MPDTTITDRIRAWCDTQDQVHDTSGCPGGADCVHAAVTAIRRVLDFGDRVRAGRVIGFLAGEHVALVEYTIARALGLTEGTHHG